MNRQIPGYYYDEEKKKYFKIQPNHAVPAGSAYSADQIKRRKAELETASEIAKDAQRKKKLVLRARILQDPLIGGSLSREHGRGWPSDGSARSYVEGWDIIELLPSEVSDSPRTQPRPMGLHLPSLYENIYARVEPDEYMHLNGSTIAMGAIEYDEATRSLFYPWNGSTLSMAAGSKPDPRGDPAYYPFFVRRGNMRLSTNHAPITSMTIEPKTRCMLTTWQAPSTGHNLHIMKLDGGEAGNGLFNGYHDPDQLGATIISRMSQVTNIAPTIWSATHGAQGSPFVFAIASDDGIVTMDESSNLQFTLFQPSAVLAVECLSQHPSVVLGGARNGYIRLHDVRDRTRQSHSDIDGIKHPSAVTKIKQLRDHIIVVAGLNSTLCNYDLRFSRYRPHHKAWPDTPFAYPRGLEMATDDVSNPVLFYPQHYNRAHLELGFDVDADAGLVAAAQADAYRTVSIFSAKTGQLLRPLLVKDVPAVSSCDKSEVKAVKFVSDRGSEHMKSLWAAKGTRVVRLGW